MDYKEIYNQWLENPYFDEATKEELNSLGMVLLSLFVVVVAIDFFSEYLRKKLS